MTTTPMHAMASALCAAALWACVTTPMRENASMQQAVEPSWPTPNSRAMPSAKLLPRNLLFGNPDRTAVKLSRDGKHLSWLAPDEGVLNVWVAPVGDLSKAAPITRDRLRGIRSYFWSYDNQHVLYMQDQGGDENWHLHAVNVRTRKDRDLTPMPKVNARVVAISHKDPGAIVVGLNDRDPAAHDLHKLDLSTGKLTLLAKNEHGFAQYLVDTDYKARFALQPLPGIGNELIYLDPETLGPGETFMMVGQEDTMTTRPLGFDAEGRTLYMFDSRHRDTGALVAVGTDSADYAVLAEDPRVDVDDWTVHPATRVPQAAAFNHLRLEWKVIDPAIAGDLEYLRTVADGDLEISDRSFDDTVWIVAYAADDGPVRYFRYDRTARRAHFLFSDEPKLENVKLARMHPMSLRSRDGLELVSYLTLPLEADPDGDGTPVQPVPMVLLVHGGPWARDRWGFDSLHQWLANRGYAALSVNFRGSTGFGKDFVNAGDKQWARAMHDDLLDAVNWAVKSGVTSQDSVAIMGASYGGYATLVGLTFTPDRFACGVDIVGPSNLETLLDTIPPYWKPLLEEFSERIGDPRTEEGRRLLAERSPLSRVDRIQRPLLIGQGANDPRVKQAESDQIVKAMQAKNLPVTYVLYPDEGHGFARPQNRLSFFAVAEKFLSRCLGGSSEPVGDDFEGSSIQIPEGARFVPGMPAVPAGSNAEHRPGNR